MRLLVNSDRRPVSQIDRPRCIVKVCLTRTALNPRCYSPFWTRVELLFKTASQVSPRAADVVDAELISMAGPARRRVKDTAVSGFNVPGERAAELVMNAVNFAVGNAPTPTRLHVSCGWYDQCHRSSRRLMRIGTVPRLCSCKA